VKKFKILNCNFWHFDAGMKDTLLGASSLGDCLREEDELKTVNSSLLKTHALR